MLDGSINILLSSVPGFGLAKTTILHTERSCTIGDLILDITHVFRGANELCVTTTSNQKLRPQSQAPVSSLLTHFDDDFVSLRICIPVLGGKGGFGSQLRAAGGRMSSKRKKSQGDSNGSSRNLDGRRLRTVTEAKALAQYLAVKPEMDKKEKEARHERWQQVVEMAEQREQEIKADSKGRVDGKWVEEKEEATERTRNAVLAAMQIEQDSNTLGAMPVEESSSGTDVSVDDADEVQTDSFKFSRASTKPLKHHISAYHGFDEDDEFMSEGSQDT